MLFEFYMFFCSGYSANRQWMNIYNTADDEDGMTDAEQKTLYEVNGNQFVGWLLWHICAMGSNGRKQMFYITFISHYHGLSRDGIDVLAKYGYGVTMDMFDNMRKSSSIKCEQKTRYQFVYVVLFMLYPV